MAVSFKVPKSPKRDIAATDAFLGVDLTNTGVSIDSYRSPNAPNMVRNVPGKIRKRMGYYTDVKFGKVDDVNFARGTSPIEQQICIDDTQTSEWIKLYDFIEDVKCGQSRPMIYIEFDYTAEEPFEIITEGITVPRGLVWTHFSTSVALGGRTLSEFNIRSAEAQSIYIKNFGLFYKRSLPYEWSPAPNYFVERESNDPVYGCHFLKKGTDGFDGDRVVNVNRVLKTSDEWEVTDLEESLNYQVAEAPCPDQTIYIDFDYELTIISPGEPVDEAVELYCCGLVLHIPPTYSSAAEHFTYSGKIETQGFFDTVFQFTKTVHSYYSFSFKIKNISIVYEKDENYKWSPAPEDNKEKFHIKDMYNIDPEDKAETNAFSKETASFTGSHDEYFQFCDENSHGGKYTYISFDISTSIANSSATLNRTYVEIQDDLNNGYVSYIPAPTAGSDYNQNFKKKHIDMFAYLEDDERYLKRILVNWNVTSGSTKANVSISNLHVKNYTIRPNFVVHSSWYLYHVGKDFYLRASDLGTFSKVFDDANEHISRSWQINDNSYIVDGKDIYEFSIEEGESVHKIEGDYAYVPTVTIQKEPSGGGQSYEAFNCLQPGFKETFSGTSGTTKYQLTFGDLDETPVKAWVADSNMNMIPKTENTDFTVNRETGQVTFNTAPGPSPQQGEPNVEIQAYRTVEGYRDRITKCTFGVMFGVAGAPDRIFLSGNPEHPNWDFYSQFKDPTYFPDTGYSVLGSEQSAINGYAIVSNYLATFKDGFDPSQAVFVREGDMLEDEEAGTSEAVFKLINTLQGEGVTAPYSVGYLQTEPVFLTKVGIYAITEQDITGEKYSQNRSFYLDGKLRKEPNMNTALAVVYDNQYILALNGQLYILDGLQATRTDKSEPYSTRQYAGFYCTDIPAITLWTDDALCFGTADGKVCRFYTDEEAITSYNDDGKPIYACWETPDLDGNLFYKNKTFRYFAARMMKAIKTSVKLYSKKLGIWTMNDQEAWQFIKEQNAVGTVFDFNDMDFNLLSFSADTTERVVHTKLRVKKVDKARFRLENGEYNEPFGLSDVALEYVESGNYKG